MNFPSFAPYLYWGPSEHGQRGAGNEFQGRCEHAPQRIKSSTKRKVPVGPEAALMLRMFARLTAKPGAASALAEVLTRLARATSREPGCIAYVVCQREDAPHVFLTFGQWRNAAASDAHLASHHVLAAIRAAESLLDVVPDVSVYRAVRTENALGALVTTDGLSVRP